MQAIGAQGILPAECREFVREYVPQILHALEILPPDQVLPLRLRWVLSWLACDPAAGPAAPGRGATPAARSHGTCCPTAAIKGNPGVTLPWACRPGDHAAAGLRLFCPPAVLNRDITQPAAQVCAFVGLCDGGGSQAQSVQGQQAMQTSHRLLAEQLAGAERAQRVGDSSLCPFCTYAVTYIKARPVGRAWCMLCILCAASPASQPARLSEEGASVHPCANAQAGVLLRVRTASARHRPSGVLGAGGSCSRRARPDCMICPAACRCLPPAPTGVCSQRLSLAAAQATPGVQAAVASKETQDQIEEQIETACNALAVFGNGQAVVDCDKLPSMPDISFSISGRNFTLTPEQYILKVGGAPRAAWQGELPRSCWPCTPCQTACSRQRAAKWDPICVATGPSGHQCRPVTCAQSVRARRSLPVARTSA